MKLLWIPLIMIAMVLAASVPGQCYSNIMAQQTNDANTIQITACPGTKTVIGNGIALGSGAITVVGAYNMIKKGASAASKTPILSTDQIVLTGKTGSTAGNNPQTGLQQTTVDDPQIDLPEDNVDNMFPSEDQIEDALDKIVIKPQLPDQALLENTGTKVIPPISEIKDNANTELIQIKEKGVGNTFVTEDDASSVSETIDEALSESDGASVVSLGEETDIAETGLDEAVTLGSTVGETSFDSATPIYLLTEENAGVGAVEGISVTGEAGSLGTLEVESDLPVVMGEISTAGIDDLIAGGTAGGDAAISAVMTEVTVDNVAIACEPLVEGAAVGVVASPYVITAALLAIAAVVVIVITATVIYVLWSVS